MKTKTKSEKTLSDLDFQIKEISEEIDDDEKLLGETEKEKQPDKKSGLLEVLRNKMKNKDEEADEETVLKELETKDDDNEDEEETEEDGLEKLDSKKKNFTYYFKKINDWAENTGSVPLTQKIFFIQNLGIMLKAGLSLGQALRAITKQSSNKKLKNILKDVTRKVEKGDAFSKSLATYPKTFNDLFVSMVASGEASGNLEEILLQVHKQLKRSHALISKVRGAMIYPIIVIVAMIGIGVGMIVFVMPKFMSIFDDFNAELPLPTRILIAISKFVENNGFFVALTTIVLVLVFLKAIKTKKGKAILHKFFLTAPVLSPIVKKINLARFARTMSSLTKSGISIIKSFKITAKTLGNMYYKEALFDAAEKVKKGTEMNTILREYPKLFPPVVTQMVTVGEESGSVEDILDEIASFYEEEVDQTMENLPSIIEPVLMLILGFGVGFMAISVLMPMYSLGEAIN
ncbi:MAG: type II secretion system F family protein [Patescibacteria group bacterium]